jgi:hypothetical protein
MVCAPPTMPLVVQVATAAVTVVSEQPTMLVPPSLKATVPVGVPPLIVAVNVTGVPGSEVAAEAVSAVVVVARNFTSSIHAASSPDESTLSFT